jgi:hypothetical protein
VGNVGGRYGNAKTRSVRTPHITGL